MNKPGNPTGASAGYDAVESRAKRTPSTDLQAEDAGTADSRVENDAPGPAGNANTASNARPAAGSSAGANAASASTSAAPPSGTPAEGAMKQTSKTGSERGAP